VHRSFQQDRVHVPWIVLYVVDVSFLRQIRLRRLSPDIHSSKKCVRYVIKCFMLPQALCRNHLRKHRMSSTLQQACPVAHCVTVKCTCCEVFCTHSIVEADIRSATETRTRLRWSEDAIFARDDKKQFMAGVRGSGWQQKTQHNFTSFSIDHIVASLSLLLLHYDMLSRCEQLCVVTRAAT
jgi:hypothetical protein